MMTMTELQTVLDEVRPNFEFNVSYVEQYLKGEGYDMGCGNCPLLLEGCNHIDISHQPTANMQIKGHVILADAVALKGPQLDYIFSSHMIEDLESKQTIIDCLNGWEDRLLKVGGHIVLLLPDMQGGRYPTVEGDGNPSHQIDVGVEFIGSIIEHLPHLLLVQIDKIPHDKSCTLDVVFRKFRAGKLPNVNEEDQPS